MSARAPAAAEQAREVGRFFDLEAARYDEAYDGSGPDAHALHVRMSTALRLLDAGPGDVLDIGMGPGRLCEQLAARGWTVSGIDPSFEMVARARARTPGAAARMWQGRAEALGLADASVDAVVGTGVLEYAADLPVVLAETARVLRPGGRAVLSIPNPRAVYAAWKRVAVYPAARLAARVGLRSRATRPRGGRPVDRPELEALLATVGLQVHVVKYTSFIALPSPLDGLLPRTTVRLACRLEGAGPTLGSRLATQIVVAAQRFT